VDRTANPLTFKTAITANPLTFKVAITANPLTFKRYRPVIPRAVGELKTRKIKKQERLKRKTVVDKLLF
jgi:hypothetical protein